MIFKKNWIDKKTCLSFAKKLRKGKEITQSLSHDPDLSVRSVFFLDPIIDYHRSLWDIAALDFDKQQLVLDAEEKFRAEGIGHALQRDHSAGEPLTGEPTNENPSAMEPSAKELAGYNLKTKKSFNTLWTNLFIWSVFIATIGSYTNILLPRIRSDLPRLIVKISQTSSQDDLILWVW